MYSICEWGENRPWEWGREVGGHYWRTTGDIYDAWESVTSIIDLQVGIEQFSGPSAWNDPDMLEVGNGGMTTTEYRAHMSMWSLLNAPLIAGNDLRDMDATTRSILTDPDLVGINQDWAGEQGTKRRDDGEAEVWSKPMSDGSVAVVLLNRGETAQTIAVEPQEIGLKSGNTHVVRDVWSDETTEASETLRAAVPSHGAATYVMREANPGERHPAHVTLAAEMAEYNEPGGQVVVTTRFFNDGRTPITDARAALEVPAGWTASSKGRMTTVQPGRSVAQTWLLTPPDDAGPGRAAVSVTGRWSFAGRTFTATTDTFVVLVEPVATGTHHLSDVPWAHSTNGWGPIERDRSNGERGRGDGGPLTIGGTSFGKGLGTNAYSSARYFTAGRCARVTARVGVDDEVGDRGSVTFEVWADGTKAAASDVLTGADGAVSLAADVTGADVVELRVTDGGDGIEYDHADWADARIDCGEAPPSDGSSYVSNLEWSSETNGWGPAERDMSNGEQSARDGGWITIAGVTYAKGIGVHAPSEIVVPLTGQCMFTSDVGVDDEAHAGATVRFRVYAGDVLVAETGVLEKGEGPTRITADLGDDAMLRLVVDDGADSYAHDHADWAAAKVTCGS